MSHGQTAKLPFRVTGTGNVVRAYMFHGKDVASGASGGTTSTGAGVKKSGELLYICFREEAAGDATTCDFKVVDRNQVIANGMTYTSIPGEKIISSGTVALTAHATTTSLDSPIDQPPTFHSSLGIVFNVTTGAGGDWAISGYLTVRA